MSTQLIVAPRFVNSTAVIRRRKLAFIRFQSHEQNIGT